MESRSPEMPDRYGNQTLWNKLRNGSPTADKISPLGKEHNFPLPTSKGDRFQDFLENKNPLYPSTSWDSDAFDGDEERELSSLHSMLRKGFFTGKGSEDHEEDEEKKSHHESDETSIAASSLSLQTDSLSVSSQLSSPRKRPSRRAPPTPTSTSTPDRERAYEGSWSDLVNELGAELFLKLGDDRKIEQLIKQGLRRKCSSYTSTDDTVMSSSSITSEHSSFSSRESQRLAKGRLVAALILWRANKIKETLLMPPPNYRDSQSTFPVNVEVDVELTVNRFI
jgi:hypothetical protein